MFQDICPVVFSRAVIDAKYRVVPAIRADARELNDNIEASNLLYVLDINPEKDRAAVNSKFLVYEAAKDPTKDTAPEKNLSRVFL